MATKDDLAKRPIPGYANEHRVKHGFDHAAEDLIRQVFTVGSGSNTEQLNRIEREIAQMREDLKLHFEETKADA